jgi:hypothetical protein
MFSSKMYIAQQKLNAATIELLFFMLILYHFHLKRAKGEMKSALFSIK